MDEQPDARPLGEGLHSALPLGTQQGGGQGGGVYLDQNVHLRGGREQRAHDGGAGCQVL